MYFDIQASSSEPHKILLFFDILALVLFLPSVFLQISLLGNKKAENGGGEDGGAQTAYSARRGRPPPAAEPATITTLRCSMNLTNSQHT